MKIFAFGLPPPGGDATVSASGEKIPSPLREAIAKEHEAKYPGVYLLAAYDSALDILAVYNRMDEAWVSGKEVDEIVLIPTGPAKGPGYIQIAWAKAGDEYPTGAIWTSTYSLTMHAWMREKAQAVAFLIGRKFRETQLFADC